MFETIINPEQLHDLAQSGKPLQIWDISYDLGDPQAGRRAFQESHLPGATFINLHDQLCAEPGRAAVSGGRHPLPTRADFSLTLGGLGLTAQTQVVVYDRNAQNFCVRAWWMLRWAGHRAVAVLDGGLQAWQAAGFPLTTTDATTATAAPTPYPLAEPLVELWSIAQVEENLRTPAAQLIDCRAPERYRGDIEPLDPRAGHIPGAANRPFTANFTAGRFKPAGQLRAELSELFAAQPPVAYCGSGVSATPLVLAAQLAGLQPPALFAGSFSEWSRRPDLEVATGPQA